MPEAKENGWSFAPEGGAGRMAWCVLWKEGGTVGGVGLSGPLGTLVALLQKEVTLCTS